jgi:hypothetical protein
MLFLPNETKQAQDTQNDKRKAGRVIAKYRRRYFFIAVVKADFLF